MLLAFEIESTRQARLLAKLKLLKASKWDAYLLRGAVVYSKAASSLLVKARFQSCTSLGWCERIEVKRKEKLVEAFGMFADVLQFYFTPIAYAV